MPPNANPDPFELPSSAKLSPGTPVTVTTVGVPGGTRTLLNCAAAGCAQATPAANDHAPVTATTRPDHDLFSTLHTLDIDRICCSRSFRSPYAWRQSTIDAAADSAGFFEHTPHLVCQTQCAHSCGTHQSQKWLGSQRRVVV
jgi:hypothetical protein